MADNENIKQKNSANRVAQAQAQSADEKVKGTEALCKKCGAALEPDLPFCTECGERIGGDELLCEFCNTKTTKEFCPHCGRRVIPINCPKCQTPSIFDACSQCGTILNPVLEMMLSQETVEPVVMSEEEAKKIEAEFKAIQPNENAEFKAFQKKLIERQILLEERDYFNKREKRIIKVFGSNPFELELPDPEEEAYRMKVYAALEKTVIEREEKAIDAELEKMFPPEVFDTDTSAEDARLAEIERNRAELERKYQEALANVDQEIQTHIEEERKRIEEEKRRLEEERKRKEEEARREAERQRQIEIERQRLEDERRKKQLNGSYYFRNADFDMTLNIVGLKSARAYYNCFVCDGSAYLDFTVTFIGNNVKLRCERLSNNSCGVTMEVSGSSGHNDDRLNFTGSLNSSGTILTGYWGNGRGSFRSQFGGGADSSASTGTFYKC